MFTPATYLKQHVDFLFYFLWLLERCYGRLNCTLNVCLFQGQTVRRLSLSERQKQSQFSLSLVYSVFVSHVVERCLYSFVLYWFIQYIKYTSLYFFRFIYCIPNCFAFWILKVWMHVYTHGACVCVWVSMCVYSV